MDQGSGFRHVLAVSAGQRSLQGACGQQAEGVAVIGLAFLEAEPAAQRPVCITLTLKVSRPKFEACLQKAGMLNQTLADEDIPRDRAKRFMHFGGDGATATALDSLRW